MCATGGSELDGSGPGSVGGPVARFAPAPNAPGAGAHFPLGSALAAQLRAPVVPLPVPAATFDAAADEFGNGETVTGIDAWLAGCAVEVSEVEEQDEELPVWAAETAPPAGALPELSAAGALPGFVPGAADPPSTGPDVGMACPTGIACPTEPQAGAGLELDDDEDGLVGPGGPPLDEPVGDAAALPGCPCGAGLEVAEPADVALVEPAVAEPVGWPELAAPLEPAEAPPAVACPPPPVDGADAPLLGSDAGEPDPDVSDAACEGDAPTADGAARADAAATTRTSAAAVTERQKTPCERPPNGTPNAPLRNLLPLSSRRSPVIRLMWI